MTAKGYGAVSLSENSASPEDASNPFLTLGPAVYRLLRWGTILGLHVGSSSRTTSASGMLVSQSRASAQLVQALAWRPHAGLTGSSEMSGVQ